ncbi:MAG: hypothetical protein F4188_00495 [Chloroflexi bacterium]|nr:hypothetical protein [Chloroflexota bacterium]
MTRDIDLLRRFDQVCVNLSITTDCEDVRRAFEPRNPPIRDRLDAAATVAAAGVPVAITLTPLLPIVDPDGFASQVAETGARRFAIDQIADTSGHFRAGTGESARCLADGLAWDSARYQHASAVITDRLAPDIRAGVAGFSPDYLLSSPAPR